MCVCVCVCADSTKMWVNFARVFPKIGLYECECVFYCHMHVFFLFKCVSLFTFSSGIYTETCPVGWGCRMHWLLLKCKSPPQWVPKIWHKTIWSWCPSNAGALGNAEYLFIAVAPWYTLSRSSSTLQDPIYGSNRTKLYTYAKLDCLK